MGNTIGKTRARRLRWFAGLAVLAMTASACASGGGSAKEAGEAEDANGVVNMVMAPDPVWKWLEDQGIKQEMEEEAGIQVLTSSSWDEFGVYAGGHADVISAATYEVPDLAEATGEPATVFGEYNTDRSILAVAPGSPYKDICDLEGKKIATFTSVSITLIWGMYAKEMCGLDLKAGGGDYELVVTDIQNLASLVARGDADACLCLPDFAIPELSSGPAQRRCTTASPPRSTGRRTSAATPRTPRTRRPTSSWRVRPGSRRTRRRRPSSSRCGTAASRSGRSTATRSSRPTRRTSPSARPRRWPSSPNWLDNKFDWFVADRLPRRRVGRR